MLDNGPVFDQKVHKKENPANNRPMPPKRTHIPPTASRPFVSQSTHSKSGSFLRNDLVVSFYLSFKNSFFILNHYPVRALYLIDELAKLMSSKELLYQHIREDHAQINETDSMRITDILCSPVIRNKNISSVFTDSYALQSRL